MFYSIFIFKENGVLLYSRNLKEGRVDDQVLVGFFSSIANFSKEALQSTITQLDLGSDTQLVMHYRPKEEIVLAALTDARDDVDKVKKILSIIAKDFVEEYGANVDESQINATALTETITRLLRRSSRKRGAAMQFIAFDFLIVFYVPLYFLMERMLPLLFQDLFGPGVVFSETFLFNQFLPRIFLASVIFVFVTIPLPTVITGFIAGEKRRAWINFVVFYILALSLLAAILQTLLSVVAILYAPFSMVIGLVFSWIGARIAEKRKLYA